MPDDGRAVVQSVQHLPLGGSLALAAVRPLVALPSRGRSGGRGCAAPSCADTRGACGELLRDGPRAAGPRRPRALLCLSLEGLVSDFMFLEVILVMEIDTKRFYEEFFHSVAGN